MKIWFDTNKKMQDGTPRTVCATNQCEFDEFERKGWKPVTGQPEKTKLPSDEGKKVAGVTKRGGVDKSPEQNILSGSAAKVIGRIDEIDDKGILESLLELERSMDKPRRKVVEALNGALNG